MRIVMGMILLMVMATAVAEDCRRSAGNAVCVSNYELEPYEIDRRWVFFVGVRPDNSCRMGLLASQVYEPGVIVQSKATSCAPLVAIYELINLSDEPRSGRVILTYGAP